VRRAVVLSETGRVCGPMRRAAKVAAERERERGRGRASWRVRSGHDQAEVPAAVVQRESRAATAGGEAMGSVGGRDRRGWVSQEQGEVGEGLNGPDAALGRVRSPHRDNAPAANCFARHAAPWGGHAVAVYTPRSLRFVKMSAVLLVVQAVEVSLFAFGEVTGLAGATSTDKPVRLVTPLSFCSQRLGHRRRRETPAHQHNSSLCCVACPLDKPPATQAVGSAIRNCPAWRRHRTPSRRTRCMPLAEPAASMANGKD
jgi:hypothetical protein